MNGPGRDPLLAVDDLHVEFRSRHGVVRAVQGVSYVLVEGQTLGIVGESGSGKTVAMLALMGLQRLVGAKVTGGSIRLRGVELVGEPESTWQKVRAQRIAMVPQEPQSALNPVFTVGWQVAELYRVHRGLGRREALARALEQLDRVRIPDRHAKARSYPHELSGGMRQRVLLAMALALEPEVLIADEPTTALDATVTRRILDLLREVTSETRMGVVLVTHDVEVASELADQIAVMYAGRIVERGPTSVVLGAPAHPYSAGLLAATPRLHGPRSTLVGIPGSPPDLSQPLAACPFAPRCSFVIDRCHTEAPPLRRIEGDRWSACHLAERVLSGATP